MALDAQTIIALVTIAGPLVSGFVGLCVRAWRSFTILKDLADQFKPNGGSSLKDRIEHIIDLCDDLRTRNTIATNLVPYCMFDADKNGLITRVNPQFVKQTDCPESELAGLGWLNLVDHTDRERVKTEWLSAVSDSRSIRVVFRTSFGNFTAVVEAYPLLSTKHGRIGMVGTFIIGDTSAQH